MESAPGDLYAQRQESTSEELFQLLHYQHPLLRGCKQHCGPTEPGRILQGPSMLREREAGRGTGHWREDSEMRTARQEDAGERERPGEREGLREKRPGEMKQTTGDIQLTKQRRPGGPQQGRGKVTTATPCRTTRAAQATLRKDTCSPRQPRLPPPPLTRGAAPKALRSDAKVSDQNPPPLCPSL